MSTLSRRRFVAGLAAVPVGTWLSQHAWANPPLLRHDIDSPMGQEMLLVYAQAVALMMARPDDDPCSWRWQHYTHFVQGSTTKAAELERIFPDPLDPRRTLADEMWNTCQSHAGQPANHFLPWHRMYVLYFEQIVRTVTGRADFTMPYWNYTSDDPAKRGVVPVQFRMPTDPVFGVLYRPDRVLLARNGQPIHKNQPVDVMDISSIMAKTAYVSAGGVQGFCRAVDSGIHGRIHVLVGNKYNFGAVPYAAQDPLFWVHHSNIDRMWASWNLNGNPNPTTGGWLNRTFVFADGNGQRVAGRLRDYMGTDVLGYGYDAYIPPAATGYATLAARSGALATAKASPECIATAASTALGARAVRTVVRPLTGKPANLLDRSGRRRSYLIIKDLHTWSQPEVLYHLYLTTPGREPGKSQYVGNINFFDAEFHDHGSAPMDEALGENFFSFDVTDVLRQLDTRQRGTRPLQLVLAPGGVPTPGAKPLVGTIELILQ
jgi:tyrosinase